MKGLYHSLAGFHAAASVPLAIQSAHNGTRDGRGTYLQLFADKLITVRILTVNNTCAGGLAVWLAHLGMFNRVPAIVSLRR
jgi:hypothetical protein